MATTLGCSMMKLLLTILWSAATKLALAQVSHECKPHMFEKAFRDCAKQGRNRAQCEAAARSRMSSCGKGQAEQDIEVREVRKQVAREEAAECKLNGNSGCEDRLYELSGETKPTDSVVAKAREDFESEKGAPKALGDKMATCQGDTQACMLEARQSLANLTNRSVSAPEAAAELWRAGDKMAGRYIRECLAGAADDATEQECLENSSAKAVAANASGRNLTDMRNFDMRKASRKEAEDQVKDVMGVCSESATSAQQRKQCRTRPDLKDKIQDSTGRNKTNITDSEVRRFIKNGAEDDVLISARTCNKTQNLSKCKEEAKRNKAKTSGKRWNEVSDYEVRKDSEKALSRSAGDKMEACVKESGASTCRTTFMKDEMKKADLKNASYEPSKGEVDRLLKDGAKERSKQIGRDCNMTRDQCFDLMQDRMAKSMGRSKSQVTKREVETLNREGAKEAALESAESCAKAKEDNASATCDDPYESFLSVRQQSKPSNARTEKVERAEVMEEAAKVMEKQNMKTCLRRSSQSEANSCLASFDGERTKVANELFKDDNETMRNKKVGRARKEASQELIGEDFDSCMDVATTSAERAACLQSVTSMKGRANLTESTDDILKKHRRDTVVKAMKSCNDTDKATCKTQARESSVARGMQKRDFGSMVKLAERKAAADTYAACKGTNETDENCMEEAKATYLEISGATNGSNDGWDSEMQSKVRKLGNGLLDNEEIVVRKKMQVDVQLETDKSTCATADHDKLITSVRTEVAGASNVPVNTFKKGECRVLHSKAEYSASGGTPGATVAQIDSLSNTIATRLEGKVVSRRLAAATAAPGRMLSSLTVTTAYAAQGAEECAASDTACGQTDSDLLGAATNSGGTSASTSGATRLVPQSMLIFSLLAMLSATLVEEFR